MSVYGVALFYALEIVTAQHFICAFTVALTGIFDLVIDVESLYFNNSSNDVKF